MDIYLKKEFEFFKVISLLEDNSDEYLKKLYKKECFKRKKYGISKPSYEMFLEMLETEKRLNFVLRECEINYKYEKIDEERIEAYYKENIDLFTRYNGDLFSLSEVKSIIIKKIREEELDKNVKLLF